MKRRATAAIDRDSFGVPARLRRCIVEDWIEPGDERVLVREFQYVNDDRTEEEYVTQGLMIFAWRRHRLARYAWLEEHGVPRERQRELIAFGRPQWR